MSYCKLAKLAVTDNCKWNGPKFEMNSMVEVYEMNFWVEINIEEGEIQ